MKAFIVFQIIMGIVCVPNQGMHFAKDNLLRSTGIREKISRDRLDKLSQYFHVADAT